MTTITKERLLTIKQWRETYGPGSNVVLPAEEAEELARIALASLEAEPVVYMWDSERKDIDAPGYYRAEHLVFAESSVKQWGGRVVPLYTAPPATVVPEFETWFNSQESGRSICSTQIRRSLQEISWNACRAAMLHGAEPVSQTYKLNELSGNSPVTPDGWISCSERMPDNDEYKPIAIFTGKCLGQGMFVATYDDDGFFDYWECMEIIGVSHWMPLPEPPQQ